MRTVTVQLRAAGLSREMVAMREWLNRNGYEATRFDCDQNGDNIFLSVDFWMDVAAKALRGALTVKMGRGITAARGQLASVRDIGRECQVGK